MASDSYNRAMQDAMAAGNMGAWQAQQIMQAARLAEQHLAPRRISPVPPPPGVPDVDARDREAMFGMYESMGIPRADIVAWYESDSADPHP